MYWHPLPLVLLLRTSTPYIYICIFTICTCFPSYLLVCTRIKRQSLRNGAGIKNLRRIGRVRNYHVINLENRRCRGAHGDGDGILAITRGLEGPLQRRPGVGRRVVAVHRDTALGIIERERSWVLDRLLDEVVVHAYGVVRSGTGV